MSANYDFKTLSPEDFERLTRDLLSASWNTRIESFKSGRDKGIDLKYSKPNSKEKIIIQCKHYAPGAFTRLKRCLQIDELPKVAKLSPSRYILVTSIPLSVNDKDLLFDLLKPWCKSTGDIYGASEINGLLVAHPTVLRAHFKLWLSSTEILEKVLHAGIWNFSAATIEELQREISRFVVHDGFQAALNILHTHHHCLIVGIPGIGKTTLAQILLWYYIQEEFTAIIVSQDIKEAWEILTRAISNREKVVVLYDDFLGQVNFESQKLEKNEDQRLLSMLELVKRHSNIRFILTTREYILADAKQQYARLAQADLNIEKFTLSLQQYTKANKARILFNHLYFSDLPQSRLDAVVKSGVYKIIVGHQNYNPRIVRGICEFSTHKFLNDEDFVSRISQQFDDPSEVWNHAFLHDIHPNSRILLYILWSFGQEATLSALNEAYSAVASDSIASVSRDSFDSALKELDGNFISTQRFKVIGNADNPEIVVRFHNPSIRDYIKHLVHTRYDVLQWLISSSLRFIQIETIFAAFQLTSINIHDSARDVIVQSLWTTSTKLLDSTNEQVVFFGAERMISTRGIERTHRLQTILSIGELIDNRNLVKQFVWPRMVSGSKWELPVSNERPLDLAHFLNRVINMGLLTETEAISAISAYHTYLLDLCDQAGWITTLAKVADVMEQYPEWFDSGDAEWLANKTCIVGEQVLDGQTDYAISLDELEEELNGLQKCIRVFQLDDLSLFERFEWVISEASQAVPDDDIDERIHSSRVEEELDIDEVFSELLDRS